VIKDAYGRLGAERFKQVTGVSVDAAKKLGQRTPRTEKAARIVEALISGDDQSHPLTVKRGNTDPNALARFADKAAAARRRCSFGDCTKPIPPRCRYCPEHRAVARRIKDRNRQRADRQRKNEK